MTLETIFVLFHSNQLKLLPSPTKSCFSGCRHAQESEDLVLSIGVESE